MRETLVEAYEELKRADHLLFVSLKYARTVDVIRNTIDRLIDAQELMLSALLELAIERGQLESTPGSPLEKAQKIRALYPDDPKVRALVELHLLLRQISKAEFERFREYRRHVAMSVKLKSGRRLDVTIDLLHDYFSRTKEFFGYTKELLGKD